MSLIYFEGNIYKCILAGVDVGLRYKVTRALKSELVFVLESIYKKGGVFKYPKVFQCDNGSEFKSDVTDLPEKLNVDIRRTQKNKITPTGI